MARRKARKRTWLSSTLITLLSVFVLVVSLGIWRYGWENVLDEILKYAIGASATAIIIAIIGFALHKPIIRLMKKV